MVEQKHQENMFAEESNFFPTEPQNIIAKALKDRWKSI